MCFYVFHFYVFLPIGLSMVRRGQVLEIIDPLESCELKRKPIGIHYVFYVFHFMFLPIEVSMI